MISHSIKLWIQLLCKDNKYMQQLQQLCPRNLLQMLHCFKKRKPFGLCAHHTNYVPNLLMSTGMAPAVPAVLCIQCPSVHCDHICTHLHTSSQLQLLNKSVCDLIMSTCPLCLTFEPFPAKSARGFAGRFHKSA